MTSERDGNRRFEGMIAARRSRPAGALGLVVLVAAIHAPAFGEEPTARSETPVPVPYVVEGSRGMFSIRPAEAVRRGGRSFAAFMEEFPNEAAAALPSRLAELLKADPPTPRLGIEDVEWLTANFSVTRDTQGGRPGPETIDVSGLTVRTKAGFDWLELLRRWRFEPAEAREAGRVYHRLSGDWTREYSGPGPVPELAALVIDDRTLVIDDEGSLRAALRGERATPEYLRGAGWERAKRALVAIAIENRDGSFVKDYGMGRAGDAAALPYFQRVERWLFELDDADEAVIRFTASCRDDEAAAALARLIGEGLPTLRETVRRSENDPIVSKGDATDRLLTGFVNGLRLDPVEGRAVVVRVDGFGSVVEFADALAAAALPDSRDEGARRVDLPFPPVPSLPEPPRP